MSSSRPVAPRRARPVIEQRSYITPQYQSRWWGRLIFLGFIFALAAAVGGFGYVYWTVNHTPSGSSRPVAFRISSGDTVATIANKLHSQGFISSPLLFRMDAKLRHLSSNLTVGVCTVRHNMSIDEMVGAVAQCHSPYVAITIPEGLRMEQIAAVLQRHGIDGASFLQEARHPDVKYLNAGILAGKPAGASLEGYLFPSTYDVLPHFSGKAFARFMVHTLDSKVTTAMRAEAQRRTGGMYRVLTLASIVEREARMPVERRHIAGVYAHRLQLGMKLDADPTVQYAVGTPGNWWPVLTLNQLHVNSAYNTYYVSAGLPPGPIANPGLSSIEAALNPMQTQDLYFVAKGKTGYHAFAKTLDEQNANIAQYQH